MKCHKQKRHEIINNCLDDVADKAGIHGLLVVLFHKKVIAPSGSAPPALPAPFWTGVQMVAAVESISKRCGMRRITDCTVKIHTAVDLCCCPDPLVHLTAQLFPEIRIGAPSLDGQKRSHVHLQAGSTSGTDIKTVVPRSFPLR